MLSNQTVTGCHLVLKGAAQNNSNNQIRIVPI